jgi:UDP-N-acetylmuramate--alanine ligase
LDHPDCYPTYREYNNAFSAFALSTKPGGTLLVCGDHENLRQLKQKASESGTRANSYGFNGECDFQAMNVSLSAEGYYTFDFARKTPQGMKVLNKSITVTLPGKHNVLNTMASLCIAEILKIDMDKAAAAVAKFNGTGRRFEIVAEVDGITLVDDYAHHPTEIKTTLAAARSRYLYSKIWAIWQPHTYSRTRGMEQEFIHSFQEADETIIMEIYASREKKEEYSSKQLVAQMDQSNTRFIPDQQSVVNTLLEELREGDVVVVLSAGDANMVNKALAGLLPGRKN